MQVFRAYMKILKKTMPSLSIYIIIFLSLSIFLSGSGKQSKISQFTSSKVNIAVINEDEGMFGGELKTYLGTIHNVVELKNDREILQDELYFRNVEYILLIPNDFTKKLEIGESENLCQNVKVPSSYTGKYLDSQIEQYISTLTIYVSSNIDEKQAVENTAIDLSQEVKVNFLSQSVNTSKADDYYYFLYLPYVFTSVIILSIGSILMTFNIKEINERNLCSSMPIIKKNFQLVLGCIITVVAVFALFMSVAIGIYGNSINIVKAVFYMINAIAFAAIVTGIGYFISVFVNNLNVLNMVSNVLGIGMSFLGGIFVPREVLGDNVVIFSKFIPTYWYVNVIELIQNVESNRSLMNEILINIGIEILFAIAIFAGALAATRIRSDARKQIS
ncbi:ABC transporter permease [Lachnotalea glycerini]|uniref:ABC transporter permease n=1 Tax=Lachnotalea glycerini TaxID=1763509 RepID=A0A255IME1_9FIRM|nr:ABC transporter permease [Lachnotalea glycerini]RDY31406.1 ABC transporter permease [Lachnotalea glycerini]